MCGRYALGIRAAFVRYQLQQQNMPVEEAPEDDEARESYNFAPGYYGLVYRMDSPRQHHHRQQRDNDTNTENQGEADEPSDKGQVPDDTPTKHKLQAMKWGLVPFWTKRNPDYKTLMRTINCRDDSLMENRGMWTSMKKTKRCIVIAQGFFEWQKKNNGKEKIPHFVKRKDGQLMLFAGLWDCVRYEGMNALPEPSSLLTFVRLREGSVDLYGMHMWRFGQP
jgi:putative SOS response-associated peptidase YedK